MGVNTNIYFGFGWMVKSTEAWSKYMEEVDYEVPEGFLYDSERKKVFIGKILDESGDLRWDNPNFSGWSGSQGEAEEALSGFIQDNPHIEETFMKCFTPDENNEASFHLFTVYS